MTKAKQQVLCAPRPRGGNPLIVLPAVPIAVRAFCRGGPKTRHRARLSRNPRKNLLLSVNYLTLLD